MKASRFVPTTAVKTCPAELRFTSRPREVWEEAQSWSPPDDAIRADYLHEAGSHGSAGTRLRIGAGRGKTSPRKVFVFAVGSNYFFEIAKLRAARTLMGDCGCGAWHRGSVTRIHVRTARANKSLYDPYTNLLRVTTEAFSAVIGGCDSLDVEPFGFDPHLAVNVQRILREEAHAGKVSDPAAGSYYIEALTDSLAREAWKVFQQIEAEGGWSKALESGTIAKALTASREAKAEGNRHAPPNSGGRQQLLRISTKRRPRSQLRPRSRAIRSPRFVWPSHSRQFGNGRPLMRDKRAGILWSCC